MNNEYVLTRTHNHTALLWGGAVLSGMLTLSLFSGFRSFPVPFDLAWQFSPIGLLQGVKPENLKLESYGYFSGHFGMTYDYLVVFLKTCIAESPFYYWCFRKHSFSEFLAVLLTANALTHPAVFFFIPTLFAKYITSALVGEAFAPAVEMLVVGYILSRTQSRKSAFIGALVILAANLFSWEVGMFV